jgi:hypothetical protein
VDVVGIELKYKLNIILPFLVYYTNLLHLCNIYLKIFNPEWFLSKCFFKFVVFPLVLTFLKQILHLDVIKSITSKLVLMFLYKLFSH